MACLLRAFVIAFCLAASLPVCTLVASAADAAVTPEQEHFFEQKVRPLLVASCAKCHGAEKQESDLRVDSRAALLKGGATGEPGVVVGHPDQSLLLKAVRWQGDVHMPPDEKERLSAEQIDILAQWVQQGMPWPESSQSAAAPLTAEEKAAAARATHWAFQPVARAKPPAIGNPAWLRTPVDAFVLARLEAAGLQPSPEADRRTLIRRLSFDLTGLPPTIEEVEAFAASTAPDAYEQLVDRLLQSPAYGERWGRHWLDVARYADTKGYAFTNERKYPYSYTYRDYVIAAMNRDLPYNQFVTEQLAADQLPPGADNLPLAGLGFLTVGRKFNNGPDDVDDLIDATARGFLGITVACARCHDHKYDAIPTEDYYSLYGVFASIEAPGELPLIGTPAQTAEYTAFLGELNKRKAEVQTYREQKRGELIGLARQQVADYLAKAMDSDRNKLIERLKFMLVEPKEMKPRLVERWRNYVRDRSKPENPVWNLWREFAEMPDDGFAEPAAKLLAELPTRAEGTEPGQCNPLLKQAILAEPPTSRMDVARIYGRVLSEAFVAWQREGANPEAFGKLPAEQRPLAEVLAGGDAPTEISFEELPRLYNRAERDHEKSLQKKVEEYEANSSAAPPRAMSVHDRQNLHNPQVFIRGNSGRPGKPVPRQFLLVMAGPERQPFKQGSGRLELAQAITAETNPLTRRVIANRLWMQHFGEPLVATPSDFGIRSDKPTHPELLDYLATRLLDSGWSLKTLQRVMVLSNTYRQVSDDRPDCREADPENRLLWKMNRRRLEFEPARDALQAVAGRLDRSMGGRPVELTGDNPSRRRAVYGFIDRQDLPNLFRVFDIASPDQSTPRRPQTTVPQQNLFLMNSPFVVDQALAVAERLPQGVDDTTRIAALYRQTLQRSPSEAEAELGKQFIAGMPMSGEIKLDAWQQYAQLLLLTNEFMYID